MYTFPPDLIKQCVHTTWEGRMIRPPPQTSRLTGKQGHDHLPPFAKSLQTKTAEIRNSFEDQLAVSN